MGQKSSRSNSMTKYETAGDLLPTRASHGGWRWRKAAKHRPHDGSDVAAVTAAGGDCVAEQQQHLDRCQQVKEDQQDNGGDMRSESKIMGLAGWLKRKMKSDAGDTCLVVKSAADADVVDMTAANVHRIDEQCNETSRVDDSIGRTDLKMRQPMTEGTASTGDIPNGW
jgi:hypothetical protein